MADAPAGDLFTAFESYCTPTKEDYESLFSNGMIVVDANVLLDLYLYHEKTREVFLRVLEKLQDRLWVPHQAVKEFWKNRDSKLRDPRESDAISHDLENRSTDTVNRLRAWSNRVRLPAADVDRLTDTLSQAFNTVVEEVRELTAGDGREYVRDPASDPLLNVIAGLLKNRVGLPFSQQEHDNAVREARLRIKEERPPGYKDADKEGVGSTGDYMLWAQLLQEAKNRKLDVLFVTSDDKEDWWRKDKDKKSLGPRPELADELMQHCGRRLFMLPPDSLLYWARTILDIDVSDESVQEVKQVSATPDITWDVNPESYSDREIALRARIKVANRLRVILAAAAEDDLKIRDHFSDVERYELERQAAAYAVDRNDLMLPGMAALERDQKFARDAMEAVDRQQADARRIEEDADRYSDMYRDGESQPDSGQ